MTHPTTRIEARRSSDGLRVDVLLAHGAFAPRLIDRTTRGARVALVSVVALLLAGDDVRIEVVVGADVELEVIDTAGTVAYDMAGARARWDVDITLGNGARLTWLGLPFVVSAGAVVHRSTTVALAHDAQLVLRETVVLGRSGELGGDLHQHTSMYAGARPVLIETLDLGPARAGFAALAGRRCLDSLTVIDGHTAPEVDPGEVTLLSLGAGGWVARSLTDQVHASGIPTVLNAHLPACGEPQS